MSTRRLTPEILGRSYDAVIVGSGLGGLTTAAFLSRYGKKVIILERHDVPGGFTHTFKRKGYEWDVGVHYVGQVGNEKSIVGRIFAYLTDSRLKWSPMGDLYDRAVIDGTTFDFVVGYEKQIAKWLEHFPSEEQALRRYYKLVRSISLKTGLFFGERSMPWFLSRTIGFFMRRGFQRIADRTTYDVLRGLTANERLISALCAQCGDYGLPSKKSSFAIHAGLVEHFLNGGSYPVGGASSIYESLLAGIEARGGQLVLKAEVKQILVENGRAKGVELVGGEKIYADKVVSGAGARNTFGRLWPEGVALPLGVAEGLKEIRPSVAHVCLYVGLKSSDVELDLPKNNFWLYDTYDFNGEFESRAKTPSMDPLLTYISFPSAKDPSWPSRYPGKATVQVIAPCPYAWVERWQETAWMKRGEEYLAFKAQWRDALLEKLYSVAPQVRGKVDHCEISTPLSTRHFSAHAHGEIYGLEHTPRRMRAKFLRAHTPIKGLFLTGQDIVMVGVGGALFSGVITAIAVLKRNVLWPVFLRWPQKLTPKRASGSIP